MKRNAGPGRKKGIILVLLLAMICMVMPMQTKTEEVIPEQTDGTVAEDSVKDDVLDDEEDGTDSWDEEDIPGSEEDGLPLNGCVRQGDRYVLYEDGSQVTQTGWQEVSGGWYLVSKGGFVTARLEKTGSIWKDYEYDSKTKQWVIRQNTWETVAGKDYYFNQNGRCSRIYDRHSKQCRKYENGRMVAVKNAVCGLRDGKKYYFDSKGIRDTKKGWKKLSGTTEVKIGKKGFVLCRMTKANGTWKYEKYDDKKQKWVKQTKAWKTVNSKKYYFNVSGHCKRMYDTIAKKCYDYKNGKMVLAKNAVRSICGKKYYFKADGVKADVEGLYMTALKKLIYVNANGRVTKEIFGEVQDYVMSGEVITSCRVRDSEYMVYYNGQGDYIKRINLSMPMVALTYDDGPSQYTQVIVDVLSQYSSRATFFVVGERVPSYSDTLKRTYDIGCEIGNHTYNHQGLTKVGVDAVQNQVGSTNATVQEITGACPVALRPPGGNYNSTVTGTVGMPLVLWSIDTLDWKTRNASSTQSAVLDHVSDGDIVLMHDLYSQTAEASKVIIPELINRGYQLVTVSELADCRGGMVAGMVYNSFR